MTQHIDLEKYFSLFRVQIVGIDQYFESPYGLKKIIYADWTASGRHYRPIEEKLLKEIGPYISDTTASRDLRALTELGVFKISESKGFGTFL